MTFAKRFKQMSDQWGKEKPAGGSRHPVGEFQGRIDKAQLKEGKTGKRKDHILVIWVIKGLTGESQGNTTFVTNDLDFQHDTFSGIAQFKGMLKVLGIKEPKNLTEKGIKKCLGEAIDCVVDYSVKANGQYTNTYVNRLVHAAGESADDLDDDDDVDDIDDDDDVDDDESEDDTDEDEDDDDLDNDDDDEDDEDDDDDDIDLDDDDDSDDDDEDEEEKAAAKKKAQRTAALNKAREAKKAKAGKKAKGKSKKGKKDKPDKPDKKGKGKKGSPKAGDSTEAWDQKW